MSLHVKVSSLKTNLAQCFCAYSLSKLSTICWDLCQADAVIERLLCLEEGGYVDVRRRLVVVLSRCRFSKRNTAELLRSDTIFVFNLR